MHCNKIKILIVDATYSGHHLNYINGLSKSEKYEIVGVLPDFKSVELSKMIKQVYVCDYIIKRDGLLGYYKWIKQICRIVKEENVDVVHFLDGDSIMRYFGMFFKYIKKPVIITYHHFFGGIIRKISYRGMCHNRYAVVHTKSIFNKLNLIGIKNTSCIEYPTFNYNELSSISKADAKKKMNIYSGRTVIGMIGAVNKYKGYDTLFSALKSVDKEYHVLIAGASKEYKYDEIVHELKQGKASFTINLKWLSHEEYNQCIACSDIIMLPYTAEFDGASGPLADGVCCDNMIISTEHGSLGSLVRDNHLGYTFEAGDSNELANILNQVSVDKFEYDKVANKYKEHLKPERFVNEYSTLYYSTLKNK